MKNKEISNHKMFRISNKKIKFSEVLQSAFFGISLNNGYPFKVWCPPKGHTYLNKSAAERPYTFKCQPHKISNTLKQIELFSLKDWMIKGFKV